MITLTPTQGAPFFCGGIDLVQNGVQYDGAARITPTAFSQCGDVLAEATLYLSGRSISGLPDFDPDAAFTLFYDPSLSQTTPQASVPAYDPTVYGGTGEPLIISGALSGAWWNPLRAGEGVLVDVARVGDRTVLFIAWFTYLAGGQQWIAGNVDLSNGDRIATLPLVRGQGAQFGAAFDPADVNFETWGNATLRFNSCNSLVIEYTGPNGTNGVLDLERLVGQLAGIVCP